jgi:hypothetical protein
MKTAIVTGSSSGCGLALSKLLVANGYKVRGIDKDLPGSVYWDTDGRYSHVQTDLSYTGWECPKCEEWECSAEVDVIAHCAGMNFIKPFPEIDFDDYHKVHNVNVLSGLKILQRFLPQLQKNKGMYITIVSNAAWVPMTGSLLYNTSKSSAAMATYELGRELSKSHNVTVMGVAPGKLASITEVGNSGVGSKMSEDIDNSVCHMRNWTMEQTKSYESANRYSDAWLTPEDVAEFMMFFINHKVIANSFRGVVLPMIHVP